MFSVAGCAHMSEITLMFPGEHTTIAKTQEMNHYDLSHPFLMASDVLEWAD